MLILLRKATGSKSLCLAFLIATAFAGACTKQKAPEGNPATLMVFNALEDGITVRANLSGKHPARYISAKQISPRNQALINTDQTLQPVAFFAAADTMPEDVPVWSGDLTLEKGKIYSMFLVTGQKGGENVLLEENLPGFSKDSLTYLRFANMGNGPAMSVNIKGNAPGSLISNIGFKEVSGFQNIPINSTVSNIVFEVRNAATGDLVMEYDATYINDFSMRNNYLHRARTIVLTGKPGGTGPNQQQHSTIIY